MTKAKIPLIIVCVLTALTVIFIFSRSIPDKVDSDKESSRVVELFELVFGKGNVNAKFVRKLAHFTEFAALGAELSVLLWVLRKKSFQAYLNVTFTASAVALCDETIQIFSGRGPRVQDVWLDISGAAFGIALLLGIRTIVDSVSKKKNGYAPSHKDVKA